MNRRGWIITDVIISITLIMIFTIPLLNINKAILHHAAKQETNQLSIEFLENSINTILNDQSITFPLIIENQDFKLIATPVSVIDDKVEKIYIEIKSNEDKVLNAFTIYREALNENQ